MADPRLHSIYFHAGRLFNTKRYANTKVHEIAKAAGVATGTVYNLFSSKKAILTFVIRASLDKGYLDGDIELPVKETDKLLLINLFEKASDRIFHEVLDITDVSGNISKSFIQMLTDYFDMSADCLLAFGNIQYNSDLLQELADAFYPARDNAFKRTEENLRIYMDFGVIRNLDFPKVHVQNIIDIITWWAMNAYIAMPDISVPREKAREIAVDLVARAYLTEYE